MICVYVYTTKPTPSQGGGCRSLLKSKERPKMTIVVFMNSNTSDNNNNISDTTTTNNNNNANTNSHQNTNNNSGCRSLLEGEAEDADLLLCDRVEEGLNAQ